MMILGWFDKNHGADGTVGLMYLIILYKLTFLVFCDTPPKPKICYNTLTSIKQRL